MAKILYAALTMQTSSATRDLPNMLAYSDLGWRSLSELFDWTNTDQSICVEIIFIFNDVLDILYVNCLHQHHLLHKFVLCASSRTISF